jgi:cation diffusion facilitator CzcD-associated flavoprotein CzcO
MKMAEEQVFRRVVRENSAEPAGPPVTPVRRPDAPEIHDVVVVGAGPYGLSTAAHLRARGLDVAVFGKVLELWRDHMPAGMLLRSHWWATNLADPRRKYGFKRFLELSARRPCYPVPIDAFVDYALWFSKHAVPDVDETYVVSIEHRNGQFLLTLKDGRRVHAPAVVMAVGLYYYANRPHEYALLSPDLVSHSFDHHDLGRFRGKQVMVIGAGQSAIEYAALLHEAGAVVHIVARRPIVWLTRDRFGERTLWERIRAPDAGIAPGWKNWILEHVPYLFQRYPQPRKDRYIRNNYVAAASDWLRPRVIGKAILHEGHTIAAMRPLRGTVEVKISDGETVLADHVVMATGYRVDVRKLPMLHPALLAQIAIDEGTPILNERFECSVPGLYFVGLSSLRAFGPLFRFVLGCKAAARRVAVAVAGQQRRR